MVAWLVGWLKLVGSKLFGKTSFHLPLADKVCSWLAASLAVSVYHRTGCVPWGNSILHVQPIGRVCCLLNWKHALYSRWPQPLSTTIIHWSSIIWWINHIDPSLSWDHCPPTTYYDSAWPSLTTIYSKLHDSDTDTPLFLLPPITIAQPGWIQKMKHLALDNHPLYDRWCNPELPKKFDFQAIQAILAIQVNPSWTKHRSPFFTIGHQPTIVDHLSNHEPLINHSLTTIIGYH